MNHDPRVTDDVDRELVAYLASTGLAVSPKIRGWWRGLTAEQRRSLLEQDLDLTG